MLSTTNFWMCFAGLVYLVAGIFVIRKDLGKAHGWDKLIALGSVFIAVPLATFAPEHFHGPDFVKNSVPAWMPDHSFWAYFIGCALLAAATSLTLRKFVRLSSSLLGLMFFLFVCMIYVPFVLAHLKSRFAWAYGLRDLSFAGGAWALAGFYSRDARPRLSRGMILFGRISVAIAAIFFAVEHFLHPKFAPGVPLETITPSWVLFPGIWGYLAGAILLVAGVALALNKRARIAAASMGALMAVLTLFLYSIILILAFRGSATEVNDAINNVADMLLFSGAALALASALPRDAAGVESYASESRLGS